MVTIFQIVEVAKNLVSDEGENPEYDRAIIEMTRDLLGLTEFDREYVASLLGVKTLSSVHLRASNTVSPRQAPPS